MSYDYRAWRLRNKDKARAYSRRWWRKNRAKTKKPPKKKKRLQPWNKGYLPRVFYPKGYPKQVQCLTCERKMRSKGPDHRICGTCKKYRFETYDGGIEPVPVHLRPVQDNEDG